MEPNAVMKMGVYNIEDSDFSSLQRQMAYSNAWWKCKINCNPCGMEVVNEAVNTNQGIGDRYESQDQ